MSDDLFHVVDDMQIILRGPKGVYKQTKAYHRAGKLYAGWSGGLIRLLASGGTSHPNVSWESMSDDPRVSRTALHIEFLPVAKVPKLVEQKDG